MKKNTNIKRNSILLCGKRLPIFGRDEKGGTSRKGMEIHIVGVVKAVRKFPLPSRNKTLGVDAFYLCIEMIIETSQIPSLACY